MMSADVNLNALTKWQVSVEVDAEYSGPIGVWWHAVGADDIGFFLRLTPEQARRVAADLIAGAEAAEKSAQ